MRLVVRSTPSTFVQLELRFLAMGNLGVEVCSVHAGAIAVTAFFDNIAYVVLSDVLKNKNMAQVRIEAFHKYVGLPMSQMSGPVHRPAVTVGTLFAQVVRQLDLHTLAAHCGDMEVFIIGLRRTKTGGVRQTRLKILGRLIEQIDAGTENQLVYQIVLIQPGAHQHGQDIHLPFILHKGTGNADILLHVAVIARHHIVHGIVLILQPARKSGGGKNPYCLRTCRLPPKSSRLSCRKRQVLLRTVIAVAVGVLNGAVQ